MTKCALVGDVGDTNARPALYNITSGEILQAKTYSGLDYPSLETVIRVYLEGHKAEVKGGCIAIACPITSDWVAMTNHTWAFSTTEMKKDLGFSHLETINGPTAIPMAIPVLKKKYLTRFGGAELVEGRPIMVYGVGTGPEVMHLVYVDKCRVDLPGEGGHVGFAPSSEEEGTILEILCTEIDHVSTERVPSGPGLANLYRTIVRAGSRLPENLKPKDITERALADSCIDCRRVLSLFCVTMGRFGGSLMPNLGAFDGVLIVGGTVPRSLESFRAFGSRATSEDKEHFKEHAHDTPVHLVAHDSPGLLDSGAYLRQTLGRTL